MARTTSSSASTTTTLTTNRKPNTPLTPTPNSGPQDDPSNLWSHLPPYTPPQTPLFNLLPKTFIPYAELMRLHKPAGYYTFLIPHLTGTLLAASRGPTTPSPTTLLRLIAFHAVASLFLRGWACSYNDALDGPFDRLVERCRHRPVARGAVSPLRAHVFAFGLAMVWIGVLAMAPGEVVILPMWLSATMLLYPWCKRFTNYPQVILGFSLAVGQGIGAGMAGWDVFEERDGWKRVGVLTMYLGAAVNAVVFDTVYAYQDVKDDMKAGVMSMAIACMGWTKQWLGLLSLLEIMLLATTGYAMGFTGAYWILSVGGTAAVLLWMLATWKIEDSADCWYWFCHLIWFTGGTICGGLFCEYVQKVW